jgi:hypothetical protein
VDEEMRGTAVAGVLDLGDSLELIDDGLDERAVAQEQLIGEGQEDIAPILAQVRDEAEALLKEELLSERRGDVALVANDLVKDLAKESMDHAWNRLAVVEIARGEAEVEQLVAIIDDQMEFEAVEPPHRRLAAPCVNAEDAMMLDPRGTADSEGGGVDDTGVDEADARARAALDVQVDG